VKLGWAIFVLLMPVTAAFAAEPSGNDQNLRIIQVDGHGTARIDPDQAFVSFAIDTKGATAREAGAQNAQIASKVIAALKSKVTSGSKVETGGYGLSPLYGNLPPQSDMRIRDWIATNAVMVESDPSIAGSAGSQTYDTSSTDVVIDRVTNLTWQRNVDRKSYLWSRIRARRKWTCRSGRARSPPRKHRS